MPRLSVCTTSNTLIARINLFKNQNFKPQRVLQIYNVCMNLYIFTKIYLFSFRIHLVHISSVRRSTFGCIRTTSLITKSRQKSTECVPEVCIYGTRRKRILNTRSIYNNSSIHRWYTQSILSYYKPPVKWKKTIVILPSSEFKRFRLRERYTHIYTRAVWVYIKII